LDHIHSIITLRVPYEVVYESQKGDEFDTSWRSLLIIIIWEIMHDCVGYIVSVFFWVPAYLKCVFWTGMTTMQRSKSTNIFFLMVMYTHQSH
jgi:hypothetical protein